MKNLILVLTLLTTLVSGQKKQDFEDLLHGYIAIMPNIDLIGSKYTIYVENNSSKKEITKEVSIQFDNVTKGTVLASTLNDSTCFVAGYLPGITGNIFNGTGDFYLWKKESGKETLVYHITGYLRKGTGTDYNKEYLEDKEKRLSVAIKDRFSVMFMIFKGNGWLFPEFY